MESNLLERLLSGSTFVNISFLFAVPIPKYHSYEGIQHIFTVTSTVHPRLNGIERTVCCVYIFSDTAPVIPCILNPVRY